MKHATSSARRVHPCLSGLLAGLVVTFASACNLLEDGIVVPLEVDRSVSIALNVGAATGAAAGAIAPEAMSYTVDAPPARVDLMADNPQLRQHRAKLVSVERVSVTVTPTSNELTSASPPLELYIAESGATSLEGAVHLGTVAGVPVGSEAPVSVTVSEEAQASAQPFLRTLAFTLFVVAAVDVDEGEVVPGGEATFELAIAAVATVDLMR